VNLCRGDVRDVLLHVLLEEALLSPYANLSHRCHWSIVQAISHVRCAYNMHIANKRRLSLGVSWPNWLGNPSGLCVRAPVPVNLHREDR
jgi:hypothetical protein